MPNTCENWLDLVNSYNYYAHQTPKIYQVLQYSVDFKARNIFPSFWHCNNKTTPSSS